MSSKTLGYRLFRWGRIPPSWRERVESEDICICDEGVPIAVTYRNYRAPGKRFGYRRSSGSGAVVVTSLRFAVFYYRWPVLDLPRTDASATLRVSASESGVVTIDFEAATLDPKRSGSVRVRIRTEHSTSIAALMKRDSPLL